MKSARRHELKKNDLNQWLTDHLETLEEHRNSIITVALAAVAAIVIGAFLMSGGDPRGAADWQTLYESYATNNRARDLKKITENNPRSSAAVLWAKKSLADEQLREGTEKLFVDRQEANDLLESAAKNYAEVEKKAAGQPVLVAQAHIGLGRVNEGLGNLDVAKKHYAQAVSAAGKSSVSGTIATEAIKRISDPRTEELLVWFQEQKPKPPKTSPGLPQGSGLDMPLPDRPDIGFPGTPFKNPAKKAAEDDAAPPAGGDAKPAEEGKSEEPKGTTEPAFDKPENAPATKGKSAEPAASDEKSQDPKSADAAPVEKAGEGKSAEEKPTDGKSAEKQQ